MPPERDDLELRLSRLAPAVEWPATPSFSPAVTRRIAVQPHWYERRWVMAAAAAVLIVALLLAYTPTRDAIADFLNLHTTISRPQVLPTPSPLPPGPLGRRLGLGNRVTLETAQASLKWQILLPPSLGLPDEVYLQTARAGPPEGEVTLVYGARPGIPVAEETGVSVLITEVRGSVDQQFFGKELDPNTTLEVVAVNEHHGWWLAGRPHIFFFVGTDGEIRTETLRLATNTLIVDEGNGTIVRIEGDLTRDQAIALAASML
jgi:hypothetical protein